MKQKEEAISKRIEALQHEMTSTGADVKQYLKNNPWVGLAGSVFAGIAVGLIAGKKSEKTRQKELVDTYIDRVAEVARETGASEQEVGVLLREALRNTMPPVVYSQPESKSSGLTGKLFGIAMDMAMGFAKKSLINFLEEQVVASAGSEPKNKADSDN